MPPDPRLYVSTTGSSAIPKRARRPKRRDPHPVPPLRRTRREGDTSTERPTRRTTHDHGPESDHSHPQSALDGPNTSTTLARRRLCIGARTNSYTILEGNDPNRPPPKGRILGLHRRRTPQRFQPMSAGIFEGSQLKGADVTPIELPNHVPTSHDGWVYTEIEPLVHESSLAAWSTVADAKAQPRPRICLPLEVESNKPPLIWDARYLNSMCKHPSFQMDGEGKVAQCSWKGAQQVTLDHKPRLTMSRWPPSPGSTTLGRYCVSDGVPPVNIPQP